MLAKVGGAGEDEAAAAEWSASCAVGESSEGSMLCIVCVGAGGDESWEAVQAVLRVEL